MLLQSYGNKDDEEMSVSIIERAHKRLWSTDEQRPSGYLEKRFLVPTSNVCERLSITGYALTNRRKDILPNNLEL